MPSTIDAATADLLRIEAGVPLFRRDMDEETIPLEAGIETSAISLSKGCYVGQEVIIRVLHRGHGRVARKLVGLTLDAVQRRRRAGTRLLADGKDVGQVTSSAALARARPPDRPRLCEARFHRPGTSGGRADRQPPGRSLPLPFLAS